VENREIVIRGAVGHLVEMFQLSAGAANAIYSLYCKQAERWEEKMDECIARIRNQRSEINRLTAELDALKSSHADKKH